MPEQRYEITKIDKNKKSAIDTIAKEFKLKFEQKFTIYKLSENQAIFVKKAFNKIDTKRNGKITKD